LSTPVTLTQTSEQQNSMIIDLQEILPQEKGERTQSTEENEP
jgi:hypothetical protein